MGEVGVIVTGKFVECCRPQNPTPGPFQLGPYIECALLARRFKEWRHRLPSRDKISGLAPSARPDLIRSALAHSDLSSYDCGRQGPIKGGQRTGQGRNPWRSPPVRISSRTMNAQEYEELAAACDALLRSSATSLGRIAIPILHLINEHPTLLAAYEPLLNAQSQRRSLRLNLPSAPTPAGAGIIVRRAMRALRADYSPQAPVRALRYQPGTWTC